MRNSTLSFILFIIISTTGYGQDHFPEKGQVWPEASADAVGLNTDSINALVQYAMDNEYSGSKDLRIAILEGFRREPFHKILGPTKKRGGPAGMVIKNGKMIASWGEIDRVEMTFSVTKSYLSTVAGLAINEGLIHNVHDRADSYVWDGTFAGEHNAQVTWDHLLTQSSNWSGSLFGVKDWADRPPREGHLDDWKYRELSTPGTVYEYNDVRVNVLAYSLLQVWRKPLPQVLKEKIMDPIGASTTWRWYGYDHSNVWIDGLQMQSVSGGGHSGGGMFINTMDQARFGYLFLKNGKWNGKQLLPESWIKEATTSSTPYASYGYMWWLNKGERSVENVPDHLFYGAGFGGNFVFIDQEADLLVVTRWLEPRKMGPFLQKLYRALNP